jgi:hypothetical protein
LSEKRATEYHFSYLLPGRQSSALRSQSRQPYWESNVRLMRIDPAIGNTLATRAPPSGVHYVWQ